MRIVSLINLSNLKNVLMNYYLEAFRKFADFKGRARRSEYWYFVLFNVIAAVVASIVDGIIGIPIFSGVYLLASLIPSLSVAVRRLHDSGRSGWMLLLGFIPLVGLIVLYFMVQDSEPGTNKWGPNPKEIGSDDIVQHLVD